MFNALPVLLSNQRTVGSVGFRTGDLGFPAVIYDSAAVFPGMLFPRKAL